MSKRRELESELPTALATLAGLLGALIVLLMGTWNGSRAWIDTSATDPVSSAL